MRDSIPPPWARVCFLAALHREQLPITIKKAGENQQRESKGCSEASQEAKIQ